MVSFTGSTRAGVAVAKAAADTVKRVAQELGGKSANIILDDADLKPAVADRRAALLHQHRPVVQRADAHARAARSCTTRPSQIAKAAAESRSRSAIRPTDGHRRSARSSSKTQFEQDPAADPEGHRRRRDARHRRPGPARGLDQRLLREADRLRERPQRHDDRARGDLRAGAVDPPVRRRGGSDPHRQRHAVRPLGLRVRPATSSARAGSRSRLRTGNVHLNGARSTSTRRSAATSSRATAASGASTASRSSSRSKAVMGYSSAA